MNGEEKVSDKVGDKVRWRGGGPRGILAVLSSCGLLALAIMSFDPYCQPYCAVLAVLSWLVDGSWEIEDGKWEWATKVRAGLARRIKRLKRVKIV